MAARLSEMVQSGEGHNSLNFCLILRLQKKKTIKDEQTNE